MNQNNFPDVVGVLRERSFFTLDPSSLFLIHAHKEREHNNFLGIVAFEKKLFSFNMNK